MKKFKVKPSPEAQPEADGTDGFEFAIGDYVRHWSDESRVHCGVMGKITSIAENSVCLIRDSQLPVQVPKHSFELVGNLQKPRLSKNFKLTSQLLRRTWLLEHFQESVLACKVASEFRCVMKSSK